MAPQTIIIGTLARETVINTKNQAFIDYPGGNILYTAYGALSVGCKCGLVTKVGENFPIGWINEVIENEVDTKGVYRIPFDLDHRQFFRVFQEGNVVNDQPQKHFLDIGKPFPKSLLGYDANLNSEQIIMSIQETTILPSDIPEDYKSANNIYFYTNDFASLSLLSSYFRSSSSPNLFFRLPGSFYKPTLIDDFSSILQSAKILFTTEMDLRNLIFGKNKSALEAAKIVGNFGIDLMIFQTIDNQIRIYDHEAKSNLLIPVNTFGSIDPVGSFDAFIGGFLGKYTRSYDPVLSATIGSAIMGIKMQGTSPAFLLDTLPELIQARAQKALDGITTL